MLRSAFAALVVILVFACVLQPEGNSPLVDAGEYLQVPADCPGGVCPLPQQVAMPEQEIVHYVSVQSEPVSYGSAGSPVMSYGCTGTAVATTYRTPVRTFVSRRPVRTFLARRPVRSFLGRVFCR